MVLLRRSVLHALSIVALLALLASSCRRDDPAEVLAIGRVETDLEAIGSDGAPLRTKVGLEEIVRESLSKATALRLTPGSSGGARLRVQARLLPDRPSNELRAFVSGRVDQGAPIELRWDAEGHASLRGDQGADELYAKLLRETTAEVLRALDDQARVTRADDAACLRSLSKARPAERAAAARMLGHRRHEPALAPLCRALEEATDDRVVAAVTDAMAELGDGRAVPCLERWAGSDPDRLERALAAVVRIGGAGYAFLDKVASNEALPERIRDRAKRGAAVVRGDASRQLLTKAAESAHEHDDEEEEEDALLMALRHEEAAVRIGAAATLVQLHRLDAVDGLCALLEREDAESVEAGLSALAELGSPRAVPCLLRWSGDDPRRLAAAIEALAMIGGPTARSALTVLARDHASPAIRRLASDALERASGASGAGQRRHR